MILSGKEIKNRMAKGDIRIRPFNEEQLNPNSYNLKLHDELVVYDEAVLDMAKDNAYHTIKIPKEGLVLEPGKLYLGRTMEFTETHNLVPMLEGRSSIGRLGIYIHVTAGFGDVGFCGCWTLEIQCVQPVRIYPFVDIGQVYYHTIDGEYEDYSSKGKYQGATGIQTSQLWKELGGKPNPLNNVCIKFKNYDPSELDDIKDMLKNAVKNNFIPKAVLSNWPHFFPTEEDVILLEKINRHDKIQELAQAAKKGIEDGLDNPIEDLAFTKSMNSARNASDLPVIEDPKVLFLCDRRACEKCNPDCTHTTDITHAADFATTVHGDFFQKLGD